MFWVMLPPVPVCSRPKASLILVGGSGGSVGSLASTVLKTPRYSLRGCLFPGSKRPSRSTHHFQPPKASPKQCEPLRMSTPHRESFHAASESWKAAGSDSSSSDESSFDDEDGAPTIK